MIITSKTNGGAREILLPFVTSDGLDLSQKRWGDEYLMAALNKYSNCCEPFEVAVIYAYTHSIDSKDTATTVLWVEEDVTKGDVFIVNIKTIVFRGILVTFAGAVFVSLTRCGRWP